MIIYNQDNKRAITQTLPMQTVTAPQSEKNTYEYILTFYYLLFKCNSHKLFQNVTS